MMTSLNTSVVVAGAEHAQSLAVIRGLGRAGMRVVAGGGSDDSIGFRSRYARETFCYRSPRADLSGFVADILGKARRAGADVIVPASPRAFAALIAARDSIEPHVRLAAPPAASLAHALDTTRTFTLANEADVAAPRWCVGPSIPDILRAARELTPPFVVRSRGRDGLHQLPEWSGIGSGVRIAADAEALRRLLEPLWDHAEAVLVHEVAQGVGRSVTGVWHRGQPIALIAYEREREWDAAGGVSVVRRSIGLDSALASAVTRLFERAAWHGVGTAEFAYDRRADCYTLTGMSGRFHAAASLCLSAGVNLAAHAVSAHLGRPSPSRVKYKVGVTSRWLRGDVLATWDAVGPRVSGKVFRIVSRPRAVWRFLRDFARPMYYDEFAADDALPAVVTLGSLFAQSVRACGRFVALVARIVVGAQNDEPAAPRRNSAQAKRAEQSV